MQFDSYGIYEHRVDQEGVYNHINYGDILFHKSSFKKEWLDEYVSNPSVIFDIGCYDGGDSLRFLTWYPNAKVYCFEAIKQNYELTLQKIGSTNININHSAVFDVDGEIEFTLIARHQNDGSLGDFMGGVYSYEPAHLFNHGLVSLPKQKVKAITIKTFCTLNNIDHIDFAHIDVEGAGLQVINGMGDICPTVIFIEFQSSGTFGGKNASDGELIHALENKGYSLEKQLTNDYLFVKK